MVQATRRRPGSAAGTAPPGEAAAAARLVPVFPDDVFPAKGVLVAVPAYNEERFIGSVVHGVRLEGFECLVVDDGSSDRTAEIAAAAGAVVRSQPENRGKCEAVALALETARRLGVETLVVMDGDWQHDPREVRSLLAPIQAGEAEIVSGSRFLDGVQQGIPRLRGLGLQAMTAVANAASGARITDSQTGFHAFSRRALESLWLRTNGFAVEVELHFVAQVCGLQHVEVPITARYDDPPKRNIVGQAARVLDGLIRLMAHYRPLLFFGVPSAIMLLVGVIVGTTVVRSYQEAGELAGGYALLAALFIIVGSIGLFAGLVLHVLRGIFLGLEQQLHAVSRAVEGRIDRR